MKTVMMKDVPLEERPRERMIREGAASLSGQELLAILLHSGTRNESVMQLAGQLISRFEGLELMKDASIEELKQIKGVGTAKAVRLLAGFEIGRRIATAVHDPRYTIRSPEDGANYVMEEMRLLKQEHFLVLFLNTKNQVLYKKTIFVGSLNSSFVHLRSNYPIICAF